MAAAAAAAAPWKTLLGQRAVSVDNFCGYAAKHLVAAFIHTQDPIHIAGAGAAEAAGEKIKAALDSLGLAAGAASLASADMLAAELIGLRGASPSPAQPLAALDQIPDSVVRTGLMILKAAYGQADDAFHLIKVARAHLSTICTLLDYSGSEMVQDLIDVERGLALAALVRASSLVQRFCQHADCARELLSSRGGT